MLSRGCLGRTMEPLDLADAIVRVMGETRNRSMRGTAVLSGVNYYSTSPAYVRR
jgi:hypothetical protein